MPATKFTIGDRVTAIALPDGFPTPRPAITGLTVTNIKLHSWIENGVDRSYYRVTAEGPGFRMVEGAEHFFEHESPETYALRAAREAFYAEVR